MPKKLERKLKRTCKERGWGGERCDRYVYGTLRETGWTPSHQKKKRKKRRRSLAKSLLGSKK